MRYRGVKKGDKWEDEASFFDVVIWGKTAESLKPKLNKGRQITVSGYLKQDRWEKDGQKQSRVQIIAEQVEVPNVKAESNSGDSFPEDTSNPFN